MRILRKRICMLLAICGMVIFAGCKISQNVSSADIAEEVYAQPIITEETIYLEKSEEHEELETTSVVYEELPEPRIDCKLSDETQHMIFEKCQEYNVDFAFTMAMIFKESSFRSDVVSSGGDYGFMQINKCNHKWLKQTLGVTDFLDPEQNVTCGLYMISNLLNKYEDPALALMAYNMGENGAKKKWDQGVYTSAYAEGILAQADEYLKEIYERMGETK